MTRKLLSTPKAVTVPNASATGKSPKWTKLPALAALCLLLLPATVPAQNMVRHYTDVDNVSIDYIQGMPWGNGYVLGGSLKRPTIGGFNNTSPVGMISRIRLQATNVALNTQLLTTYVDSAEIQLMQSSGCGRLNLWFTTTDTKQTQDGGFIICGRVRKNVEDGGCGGPAVDEPFLLKTDRAGVPRWYMRYNNKANFTSVVEDPVTDNFIVCGTYGQEAMVAGMDKNGNSLWTTTIPLTSAYSEVAPFTSGGKTYYAVVGNSNKNVSASDMLLTVVDANGVHYQDAILKRGNPSIQGWGVHDANDGSVVITGETSEYYSDPGNTFFINPVIIKIQPLTLSLSFVKAYFYFVSAADSFTRGSGRSIVHAPGIQGNISVTGWGGFVDWAYSNVWLAGLYLEVKYDGSLVRYTHLAPDIAYSGKGIVNNGATGYPAFSGFTYNNESFAIRNNYGFDCGNDIPVSDRDLELNITRITYKSIGKIPGKKYSIVRYPVNVNEYLACGVPKPGPTSVANVSATNDIVVFPNPANDKLEVSAGNVQLRKISVYEISGRIVSTQQAAGATTTIDVSRLAAGTYILVAEDAKGKTERQKFVKE
ncbi:T9SS type A sorting domain-containing protein [Taibaiella koreensis]|uniref:T9SS type A sorting domain-containing protein n=1 Tax=Taibaiella koreensis TaxID=1268548 RepID=UPI000E59FD4A|nr:T9SS type A sorting domain-containing protein [Taibaiella koreensis]